MVKRRTAKSLILLLLAITTVLSSCKGAGENAGNPVINVNATQVTDRESMLPEAQILYEKEEMKPGILVDLKGYDTEGEKLAIFEGDILPRLFFLIDNVTNETVYTGSVEVRYEADDENKASGVGDFSCVTEPGDYHIEADFLGASKDFKILPEMYEDLLASTFEGLKSLRMDDQKPEYIGLEDQLLTKIEVSGGWSTGSDGQRDVAEGCLAILDLIKAYEYFQQALNDNLAAGEDTETGSAVLDEVIFEAKWLMKMQNPETGGVYTGITLKKENENDPGKLVVVGETTRATAYYCAVMAELSYVLTKAVPSFSQECLKRAMLAWNCIEANKELVTESQKFRAAVEMYRATGNSVYKDVLNEYLKVHADRDFEERLELDAAMSYMSTSKNVELEYCTTLMRHFMSKTENIAVNSKEARYLVEEGVFDEAVLLRNVSELVEADFILTSQEYYRIEINYLHYFFGRNPESEICTALSGNPDFYAQFMILLGNLLSK